MTKTRIAIAGVVAATLACIATPANAATLTLSGTGWKAGVVHNITSIRPSQQYTVTFSSATTKNLTAKYLTKALPQINAAGVKLVIGGVETVEAGKCPPRGHIWIQRKYRPLGKAGFSRALPCYDSSDNSAFGGVVQMDSEYYDGTLKYPTYKMYNFHVHEVLHALGLEHPNYDKDRDGKVENYECVTTSYGNRPVMCSPNGGYSTSTNMGKLVGYDINGLKAMLNNARIQGIN